MDFWTRTHKEKGLLFNSQTPGSILSPFASLPKSSPLQTLPDGSLFPAKPYSEERESGTRETVIGGPWQSHYVPVGSLLLRVSGILDDAK